LELEGCCKNCEALAAWNREIGTGFGERPPAALRRLSPFARGRMHCPFAVCGRTERTVALPPLQEGECIVPLAKGDSREAAGGRSQVRLSHVQWYQSF